MKTTTVIYLGLLFLMIMGMAILTASRSVERVAIHALDLAAMEAEKPASITDKVAFSRSAFTNERQTRSGDWPLYVAISLIALIAVALSVTPLMLHGGEFLRQARLFKKGKAKGRAAVSPFPNIIRQNTLPSEPEHPAWVQPSLASGAQQQEREAQAGQEWLE